MYKKDFSKYMTMTPKQLRIRQITRGFPMSVVGAIVFIVFYICGQRPKSYKGVCPYFEIGWGWGGVAMGWFFICCKDSWESTKQHESGHLVQAAAFNGLAMIALSIGSAVRYWWREIFGEKTPYDSWWFEGQATDIGTKYVRNIEQKRKGEKGIDGTCKNY